MKKDLNKRIKRHQLIENMILHEFTIIEAKNMKLV